MTGEREWPDRRWARLRAYDYAQVGSYAVTICTQHRMLLFGDVVDGEMRLNDAGRMVVDEWNRLPDRFDHVELDTFIVMPNHLHGIVVVTRETRRDEPCVRPVPLSNETVRREPGHRPTGTSKGSLSRIVQAFKSTTTRRYIDGVRRSCWSPFDKKLWQGSFYDHVIRDDRDLDRTRKYIIENPVRWMYDRENPMREEHPNRLP